MRFTTPPEGQEAFFSQTLAKQQKYHFRQKVNTAVVTALTLFFSLSLASGVGWFFYMLESPRLVTYVGRAKFLVSSGVLVLRDDLGNDIFSANLAENLDQGLILEGFCDLDIEGTDGFCIVIDNNVTLQIAHEEHSTYGECYNIQWRLPACRQEEIRDCFSGSLGLWFGGSLSQFIAPQRKETMGMPSSWGRGGCISTTEDFGALDSKVLISSSGLRLNIHKGNAFTVSLTNGGRCGNQYVCLHEHMPKAEDKNYEYWHQHYRQMSYSVCIGDSVKDQWDSSNHTAITNEDTHPHKQSHLTLLHDPFLVIPNADLELLTSEWPNISNMTAGSALQRVVFLCPNCYDPVNQPIKVTQEGQSQHGRHKHGSPHIALPVHPLTDVNSILTKQWKVIEPLDMVLKDPVNVPVFFRSGNSTVFMYNLENDQIKLYLVERISRALENLHHHKIKVLYVTNYVDWIVSNGDVHFYNKVKGRVIYNTRLYLSLLSQSFPHLPVVSDPVTLPDRPGTVIPVSPPLLPVWGPGGLADLIPHTLVTSLLQPHTGQPYISPAPNNVSLTCDSANALMEEELFIRWLQAAILFPVIQLPAVPWCYKPSTLHYTKKLLSIHQAYVAKMVSILTSNQSDPIIKPIWMLGNSSRDPEAFGVVDQYLMGDHVMVAPIIHKSAIKRDIYFPLIQDGWWWDNLRYEKVSGGFWHYDYKVELYEVPHFTLMTAVP